MPYSSVESDLPKVAKGVFFKRVPPVPLKMVPQVLVDLLNDTARILAVYYKREHDVLNSGRILPGCENGRIEGVSVSISADWLAERKWKIELSATNALPRPVGDPWLPNGFPDGLPDGGLIKSLEEFQQAVASINQLLNTYDPKKPTQGKWNLMGGLTTYFENPVWSTRPGAEGEDGVSRGVVIVLNCATKPGVGMVDGKDYWLPKEGGK